jgi:hypothetical protein
MDIIIVVGGAVIFALVALAVYAIVIQRRSVRTQNTVVSASLPAQQEGLTLAREAVELQREANRMLAVIAKALERQ